MRRILDVIMFAVMLGEFSVAYAQKIQLSEYEQKTSRIGTAEITVDGICYEAAAMITDNYVQLVECEGISGILGIDFEYTDGTFSFNTNGTHELSYDFSMVNQPAEELIYELAGAAAVVNGEESGFIFLGGGTLLTNGQKNEKSFLPRVYKDKVYAPVDFFEKINSAAVKEQNIITVTDKLVITVNGRELDFKIKPFVDENDRMQVSVREFCEQTGYEVSWIEESKTVSISMYMPDADSKGGAGGDSYWFTVGESRYRINSRYYEMDTAARLVGGRTYIPLRYLAEMMGYKVEYKKSE